MGDTNITIKDVARRAEVSISTVSRVLNDLDRVSKKTRDKVSQAVKELDFVPDNIAKTMITKKSKMIAVVVPELSNSFYIDVILGTERVLKENGYQAMIFSTENSAETEIAMAASSFEKMADGIVLIPTVQDLSIYSHFGNKIVLVDRYVPGGNSNAVVIDNFGGAYMMTNYLLHRGHTKIAIINGNEDFNNGRERKAGYVSAVQSKKVAINEEYIYAGEWDDKTGYDGMGYLLSLAKPPTAIFCLNNRICSGAITYLADNNLKAGIDISLVGFDDNRLARFIKPSITVVDRATIEMGECAAKRLIEEIENTNARAKPLTITLPTQIIERESVIQL